MNNSIPHKKHKENQRIRLLNEYEINAIYSLPRFTEAERHYFFQLSAEELEVLKGLHYSSRLYFILQLGYFRAKHLLFDFTFYAVREDVKYVLSRYFPQSKRPNKLPTRNRLTAANKKILAMLGFQNQSAQIQKMMAENLAQSIRQVNKPILLLRNLLSYLHNEKIVFPSYSTLQDMVGNSIIDEEIRIHTAVKIHVTKKTTKLLDKLFTVQEQQRFYDLTLLKQYPKNFNFKMIQTELEKHKRYYPLYQFAKRFLPKLNISQQNIAYYSSLVEYYQVQSLQRFSQEKRYFYLLCYVHHRFRIMTDQLIETLSHYIDAYNKEAKAYAKIRAGEVNSDVKTKYGPLARTLLYWYFDQSLSKKSYDEIQRNALHVLSKDNIILVGEFLANDEVDKKRYEWEFHDNNFQAMIKNCRPLIMALDFQAMPHNQRVLVRRIQQSIL